MKTENIAMGVIVVVIMGIGVGAYMNMAKGADVPDVPVTGGLTERGLEVKADIVEREARGFVQYTGTAYIQPIVVVEQVIPVSEVEVITYKLTYENVTVMFPENLEGYDTIAQRAVLYEDALRIQMSTIDTLVQDKYHSGGKSAYSAFYTAFWQDKLNDYVDFYEVLGNTILSDTEKAYKISLNCSA